MPAVKAARPKDIFTAAEWKRLTSISPIRGYWLTLHGWLLVTLAAGGAALLWEWSWIAGAIATPIAIALVGGRQLGLSILMHDGAHGLLHPRRKTNNFVGQWLTGAATRQRSAKLPRLSSDPSQIYPAGRRPRSRPFKTIPDFARQYAAKDYPRFDRADISQAARQSIWRGMDRPESDVCQQC